MTQRLCHVKSHTTDARRTATTVAPETRMTVIVLSQKLTSLSDLGTLTTTKAVMATTATTPAESEVPEEIEPMRSVLILPKDIEPEEVIRLADSHPVENAKIIVDLTQIVQNQAIDGLKQD